MNRLTTNIFERSVPFHPNRWSEVSRVSAEISSSGALLQVIGNSTTLKKVNVVIEPQLLRVSLAAPFRNGLSAILEEERVTLLSHTESTSFPLKDLQYAWNQRWDAELLAVFAAELSEVLLLTPHLLASSYVETAEAEPPSELKGVGRSLVVDFRQRFISLSRHQSFHFDGAGLLLRHDFIINYMNGSRVTRYPSQYETVQGLSIPTVHEILVRLPDNSVLPEPIVLFVKVNNLKIETNAAEGESL